MSLAAPFFVCRLEHVPYRPGRLNVVRATYETEHGLEAGVAIDGDVTSVAYRDLIVLYVPEAS